MFINVIKSYREVVALCDSSILGKRFEQQVNGVVRQLDVKESFYKGEEISEEKAIEILKEMASEDATFNIAGNESVSTAIKAGIITRDSVGEIQGIPFALVLL
jgi:hypothetical protein